MLWFVSVCYQRWYNCNLLVLEVRWNGNAILHAIVLMLLLKSDRFSHLSWMFPLNCRNDFPVCNLSGNVELSPTGFVSQMFMFDLLLEKLSWVLDAQYVAILSPLAFHTIKSLNCSKIQLWRSSAIYADLWLLPFVNFDFYTSQI